MLRIFIAVLIIIGPLTWYFYESSKEDVVAEMIAASENEDVEAMAARFKWDELRVQLKENIRARKAALGSYGTSIGPAVSQIDDIVDYYVQPENIELAYYYHNELFPDVPENAFIREIAYAPPFGFSILMGFPTEVDTGLSVDPMLQDRLRARFIFRLDGLTWKVHEINIPIYIVPRRAYDRPALERFGDPEHYSY
ncbi:MAG: hypothetical protein ACQEQL_03700 [Pseudomonadota bacterium]